jgi:hypothetical protein
MTTSDDPCRSLWDPNVKPLKPHPRYLAKDSSAAEFFDAYDRRMATWRLNESGNAIWGAVANRDPLARGVIVNRLLDDGADATVHDHDGTNLLHILFSHRAFNFVSDGALLHRLLLGGADINMRDRHRQTGVPLKVLLSNPRLRFEPAVFPIYDAIFAQSGIDWEAHTMSVKSGNPQTLRELAELAAVRPIPGKTPDFARRMREYEATGGVGLPYEG